MEIQSVFMWNGILNFVKMAVAPKVTGSMKSLSKF
jgi:hypothetical protein